MSERTRAVLAADKSAHQIDIDEQLSVAQLAFYLCKSESFIYAMMKAGFEMPKDPVLRYRTASYSKARKWLTDNPDFTFDGVYRK